MTESTCLKLIYRFCTSVVATAGGEYLREPNVVDTTRLLSIRGFLECLEAYIVAPEWKNYIFD
jgi:hypothetical protein